MPISTYSESKFLTGVVVQCNGKDFKCLSLVAYNLASPYNQSGSYYPEQEGNFMNQDL